MGYSRKLQVFVSSTFLDLRRERQAAVSAILELGHIPAGMELFAAGDQEQMKVIRRWIDDSDIFALILGGRYGSVEPLSGKSYTHLEYEYAAAHGKPYFAIVLTDRSRDGRINDGESIADLIEGASPQKFTDFRMGVTSKLCKFADDHKDIKLGVWQSIRDLEQRVEFTGWVSGRASPDTSKLLADVAAAAKHSADVEDANRRLSEQVMKLQMQESRREAFGGWTYDELCAALRGEIVELKDSSGGKAIRENLLSILVLTASHLANGVSNAFGRDSSEVELYNRVASPLFVYGLTEHAKVPPRVTWHRLVLSKSGQRFVTEFRVRLARTNAGAPNASAERTESGPDPTVSGTEERLTEVKQSTTSRGGQDPPPMRKPRRKVPPSRS